MKGKRLLGILAVLLCGAAVIAGITVAPSLAAANRINTTLVELNALNAVEIKDDPLISLYTEKGKNITIYEDVTSGYNYRFEKNTGILLGMRLNVEGSNRAWENAQHKEKMESDQLLSLAHSFVKARLNENYVLIDSHNSGTMQSYAFEEWIEGVPSGAQSRLTLYSDGTIFSYSFVPAASESPISGDSMADAKEAIMLTQEEAQKIALQLGVEYATEHGELPVELGECKLVAYCGKPCYEVKLNATCNCGYPHYRVYKAYIDPYTGESHGLDISK